MAQLNIFQLGHRISINAETTEVVLRSDGTRFARPSTSSSGIWRRNLTSIAYLIECGTSLLAAGRHWYRKLLVASELTSQQQILYNSESRSIPYQIVRMTQPHIRPIVRGKARNNVEFGAKISISVTGEGVTFLIRLSLDPYNEADDLNAQVRAYQRRHGYYRKVVCADQIYRRQSNHAFCKQYHIRLSVPHLGRSKKHTESLAEERQIALEHQRQRNGVEGRFGQGKRCFGLDLIREKNVETSGCTTAMKRLIMNLQRLLELLVVFVDELYWYMMASFTSERRIAVLSSLRT